MSNRKKKSFYDELSSFSKEYREHFELTNSLGAELADAQLEASVNLKMQKRNLESIILDGHTKSRHKNIEILDERVLASSAAVNEVNDKYQKALLKSDKMDIKYNYLVNRYYKRAAFFNSIWILTTLSFIVCINSIMNLTLPAEFISTWNSFFVNVDDKFYEASFQLLLALLIALFIGRAKKKQDKARPWEQYSKFSSGVSSSVLGIAACLLVLGGASSNIFFLSIIIISTITLLYYAISPLWKND